MVARRRPAARLARAPLGASTLFVVAYFVYFGRLTSAVHNGYGDRTFDIGLYDQGVWLLSRFHAPFVTLMGRNLFGDHAQFTLLALVPLYWIRPDATTLLWVQAAAMAAGAVPVYLLAMRRLRNPVFATVFVGAFLLHPALGLTNLENYHPDSFLIPILASALRRDREPAPPVRRVQRARTARQGRCRAHPPAASALWYAWRRNRRVGAWVAAASVAWAAIAMAVIMRSLVGISTRNAGRIPFSTCVASCSVTRHVADFGRTLVTKPGEVLRYLRSDGRPFYAWQMLAPTGLVVLVAPEIAATATVVLLANLFSTTVFQHSIAFHYSMVLVPALSLGTIYAVSKITRPRSRTIAVAIVGGASLLGAYLWGPLPLARHPFVNHASPHTSEVAAIHSVTAALPPNAVVSVYDWYVTHVDHRQRVYLWPTPFDAQHWGLFQQEGRQLPFANDVQYLLLPTNLTDHPDVLARSRPTSSRSRAPRTRTIGARCSTGGSVPEVRELQRHPEVVLSELADRRLQVVALLAGDTELFALHLVLHSLEAEALDVLADLLGLVLVDAGLQRAGCRARPPWPPRLWRSRAPSARPCA